MVEKRPTISPVPLATEGIDFEKLKIIVRKNFLWLVLILLVTNLSAYLYLRYTKNVYEAASELKLDNKQEATEFGITSLAENQNLNMISGEIEQIKSRLFLNRVIDSLDIWVSYHSVGKFLIDEMYKRSPFSVEFSTFDHAYLNTPIYFNFIDPTTYKLTIRDSIVQGRVGQKVKLGNLELTVNKTYFYTLYNEDDYFFILHSRDDLLNYMAAFTRVEPLNFEANTIRVSFQDYNPMKARDIVNKIDSNYLFYSNEQKNLTNTQKISWLDDELRQIEKKMEDYENYFENFTLQNKSSNINTDLEKTINTLYEVDSQRYVLTRHLADVNAVLDKFAKDDYALTYSSRAGLPAYLSKPLEDLKRVYQEKEKLGLSYNESTLAYKQKDRELAVMREQVITQFQEIRREWLKSLDELNSKKALIEQKFAGMPDKNTQFTKNQRFYKLYEEFYLSMMQSKAGFEIAQAGSTPDFKILSSPSTPTQPISPKRMIISGIGFSSGIMVCIFFIGLLYLANNKVTSVSDIERGTNVPVLAVIPESKHTSKTPFHVLDNPKSMVSEAIRTIRTNLDFFSVSGTRKTISISSTISGEGKSFLALNLGGVIAMSKRKVVLIDLDMRKPKHDIPFTIPDVQKGMSTALIRKYTIEECIVHTGIDNFDYVPAGPHPPNPSELLMNGDFTYILDRLKEMYEFVIVDTPPVGLVTDGIMAMKKTDVSIYVVRANYSKKEFLQNITRLQQLHKLTNVSVIFNAVPSSGKMYGYGYYVDQTPLQKGWRNFFRG